MTIETLKVGESYECFVNGRVMVVKILEVKDFGLGGVKIVFQNARFPGRKMERYSARDFREVKGST